MKQAFRRTGARFRHAFQNEASFSAKRLILVEQMKKNGLNKEIRRPEESSGAYKPLVNHNSARGVLSGSRNPGRR